MPTTSFDAAWALSESLVKREIVGSHWVVAWSYLDGARGIKTFPLTEIGQSAARRQDKELRVFLTLMAMGVKRAEASRFGVEASKGGSVRKHILDFMAAKRREKGWQFGRPKKEHTAAGRTPVLTKGK